MKQYLIFTYILIVLATSVYSVGPLLTGACNFRSSCNAGEYAIAYVGDLSSPDHLFHSSSASTVGAVCCPATASLGGVTSSCSLTSVVVRGDNSDTGGTHVEQNAQINGAYGTNVCIVASTSDTSVTCSYTSSGGSCSAGSYCVMSIGGLTNSHIAPCSYSTADIPPNNQNIKVCCSTCIKDTMECSVDANCCGGSYCSHGRYGDISQGHCCTNGQVYDQGSGLCVDMSQCGFGPSYNCVINPESDLIDWFNDPDCVRMTQQDACCGGIDFIEPNGAYYYPIEIYDPN